MGIATLLTLLPGEDIVFMDESPSPVDMTAVIISILSICCLLAIIVGVLIYRHRQVPHSLKGKFLVFTKLALMTQTSSSQS